MSLSRTAEPWEMTACVHRGPLLISQLYTLHLLDSRPKKSSCHIYSHAGKEQGNQQIPQATWQYTKTFREGLSVPHLNGYSFSQYKLQCIYQNNLSSAVNENSRSC